VNCNKEEDTANKAATNTNAKEVDCWGIDNGGGWGDDTNETDNCGGDDDDDMDEIEAMLAANEIRCTESDSKNTHNFLKQFQTTSVGSDQPKTIVGTCNGATNCIFPQHELELFDEPMLSEQAANNTYNEDDEDDVVPNNIKRNDNIHSILSKYLNEEEDVDLVSSLQDCLASGSGDGSSSSGGGGEQYEKIPLAARVFLSFTERLKCAPQQVARYAYGAQPMWSI